MCQDTIHSQKLFIPLLGYKVKFVPQKGHKFEKQLFLAFLWEKNKQSTETRVG